MDRGYSERITQTNRTPSTAHRIPKRSWEDCNGKKTVHTEAVSWLLFKAMFTEVLGIEVEFSEQSNFSAKEFLGSDSNTVSDRM